MISPGPLAASSCSVRCHQRNVSLGFAATLTALQTRISAYVEAIAKPRAERVKKSTATDLLGAEFARVDMILEDRIDGLMEQFKETNPTFYSDYQKARRIVDTGGRLRATSRAAANSTYALVTSGLQSRE